MHEFAKIHRDIKKILTLDKLFIMYKQQLGGLIKLNISRVLIVMVWEQDTIFKKLTKYSEFTNINRVIKKSYTVDECFKTHG